MILQLTERAQDAKDLASLTFINSFAAPPIFTQSAKGWNWSECTLACYLQSPIYLSVSNLPEGNNTKIHDFVLKKLFPFEL
jgi:hypothetical protein